ncbi:MAG: Nucleoside ABC transporter, ATP-binding protein, partial [uncultured Ramlibacter sp.]
DRRAPPAAAGHHQALPVGGGQRWHLAVGAARPDARGARGERRRQVHADEDHLRLGQARRRPGTVEWRDGAGAQPAGGAGAGHQHGVPAFQPVRHPDRGRERLARPGQASAAGRSGPADRGQGGGVRAARGPGPAGAHAVGGRDAAGRDHPGAAHRPAPADPGRADLGADPAGGRQAVRGAAQAGLGRLQHPVHQPQAARDPRAVRRLHRAARRQGHVRVRPEAGEQCIAQPDDDRRRAAQAAA